MSGPALGRAPFLAAGFAALGLGLWSGLARTGLAVGAPVDLARAHGPLMVVAFLGTVIGAERAAALERRAAWAVPVACAVGGVGAAVGVPTAGLAALGMAGLIWIFIVIARREPSVHTTVMLGAAIVGALATGAWALGARVDQVVPAWMLFLLATIAGERLELTRLAPPPRVAGQVLVGMLALAALLVALVAIGPMAGRALGLVLLGVAAWLLRFDVARHTWRTSGLPRFSATCLLVGYGWLGVSGALIAGWGLQVAGLRYDAQVHSFFVGFVFSMILGHAPIVFPAVLRITVPFRARAWAPFFAVHAALLFRVIGDVRLDAGARTAGSVASTAAIVLFLVTTLSMTVPAVRAAVRAGRAA